MKSGKILVIGDSLALPGHGNLYEDTWVFKLKCALSDYDIITFLKRQLTTDVLVTMGGGGNGMDKYPKGADCLEFFDPNYVILQLGIVDASPRLLYSIERSILQRLPEFVSKFYVEIVKNIRKRSIKNVIVPIDKFTANLENYCKRAEILNTKIIIIKICTPDSKMVEKNPNILVNITKYNYIIDSISRKCKGVTVIDPLNSRNFSESIFEDGYHPNKEGHKIVFKELLGVYEQKSN